MKFLPDKHREIAAADPALKDALRDLVRGNLAWPLLLYGPPGRGKTCAALALLDHLRPFEQQYMTAAELTSRIMAGWKAEKQFDWSTIGPFKEVFAQHSTHSPPKRSGASLVVLDEIGTRSNISDTHYDAVQRVLDDREGQPLIVVTNLDLDGISKVYDARIASRCLAGTAIRLEGRDRRIN